MVDEPTSGIYYGSQVAAPVISQVLSEILPYLQIPADSENTLKVIKVGEYKGAEVEQAKYTIEKLGLNCVIKGNGATVIDQFPRVGTSVTEGGTVILYTEPNYTPESIRIRDLTDMTPEQVFSWAKENKLNLSVEGIFNKNYRNCFAVSQSVAPGETVNAGTVITVTFIYNEEINDDTHYFRPDCTSRFGYFKGKCRKGSYKRVHRQPGIPGKGLVCCHKRR